MQAMAVEYSSMLSDEVMRVAALFESRSSRIAGNHLAKRFPPACHIACTA